MMSAPEALHGVYEHVEASFDGDYLPLILDLVRVRSVAAEHVGIEECAELVRALIQRLGSSDIRLVRYGTGSPIVVGTVPADSPTTTTIIMYGMYDVQPPDPLEEWTVPPYKGAIKDVPPYGPCVVARGVTNSKGPLVCFIAAIDAIKRTRPGGLPVNVLFVVEGEEEMGSPSLIPFVREHLAVLGAAQGVFLNGARQDEQGRPVMILGNKGIVYLDLRVQGGSWGGPRSVDVHSMNAAWVDSPVWRLVHALHALRPSPDHIAVDGFYDHVRSPTTRDEALLGDLAQTFDEEMFVKRLDVARFRGDLRRIDALREFLFTPTLNIDGIWGGYRGPATKTVLPYEAGAKIDIRLVPDMRADDVIAKVRRCLADAGFGDLRIDVRQSSPWSKTDPDHPMARAAMAAMRSSGYGQGQVWPLLPGTGPAYLFTQPPLSLAFVSYGLGHGGRIHAPDEYFVLKGLVDNIKSSASFLLHYASMAAGN